MDVCLISNLYPPAVIGGAEKHAAGDARQLAKGGHDVSVITTSADGYMREITHEQSDSVDVYRFRPMNMYAPYEHQDAPSWKKPVQHIIDLWNPHTYRIISSLLADIDPELIHVHNFGGLSHSTLTAAGNFDAPVVHTLHDYGALHVRANLFVDGDIVEPGFTMKPYQKYNERVIGANVDRILAPSQFIIDMHESAGMFANTPTDRLPLGVESTGDREVPESDDTDDRCRLLYAGQLTRSKGVDVLIEAVKQLEMEDVELNILGKGPQKNALRKKASHDDRIQFHGFVPEKELEQNYTTSDYTIVPSRWYDNSPMVIYESFLRNTPVIGANIGGIPELITEGETGYVFEPEDSSSLADVIRNHQNRSEQLSENVAQVDVSIEHHVNELESIYEALISDHWADAS